MYAQNNSNFQKHFVFYVRAVRFCGGIAGITCPRGLRCVDDPRDSCDPKNGGADCGGICVPPASVPICKVGTTGICGNRDNVRVNPCTFGTCIDGKWSIAVIDCAAPCCQNPVVPCGQCCPICPNGCGFLTPSMSLNFFCTGL